MGHASCSTESALLLIDHAAQRPRLPPTPSLPSYVGTLPGKIDLYVGKEVVRRNVDMVSWPEPLRRYKAK